MRDFLKMRDFCHTSLFLSREDFSVEYATILRNCGRKIRNERILKIERFLRTGRILRKERFLKNEIIMRKVY